ncbi:MAG: 30S ribosomal protein S27ae [Methanomethylophilus sp.]|jgi:small subunit ribosomal protein S27Ae
MAKKEEKKKAENKRDLYTVEGDKVVRSRKECPKCGPGVFLAQHKDRLSCGKCGYTEFLNKDKKE